METKAEKGFLRELCAVALPIALQSLLSALVGASDALMLGFLDQASLSAISLAGNVWFVLNLFQLSFMIGASILGAQYWGKGDQDTVEKVLGLSLRASIPVSMLFFLAALAVPGSLMRIFTPEEALISRGIPYLRIVSVTYLITGVTTMYVNIMRNSGQVKKSVMIGSTGVAVNIILNLILIFGIFGLPGLGILGAALATVVARVVELTWCLIESRKEGHIHIRREYLLHADKPLRKQYWHHLTPVMANEIVWGGGVTAASVIMGHLGSDAVAAHAIAGIIQNILRCFCSGVGSAGGIMLGNLMGAGKLEKAKAYSKKLIAAALITGACAGLTILAVSPLVMRFSFSLTDQAREYLRLMLYVGAYYVIGKSLNELLMVGIFCAGGDTRFGFYCDLINAWCFILPLAALAAFIMKWPVMIVYVILNFDEIGKIPFEIHHYRKYKWLKNLTNGGEA